MEKKSLSELILEVEKTQWPLPDTGRIDEFNLHHDVSGERCRHWFAEYKIKAWNMTEEFYENDFKEEVFRCAGDTPEEAVLALYSVLSKK